MEALFFRDPAARLAVCREHRFSNWQPGRSTQPRPASEPDNGAYVSIHRKASGCFKAHCFLVKVCNEAATSVVTCFWPFVGRERIAFPKDSEDAR
jgi:hypothetical protein